MATIAGILDRLALARTYDQITSRAGAEKDDQFRLRPVANEQIYFFAKRIDNSRVVRQADPAAGRICWRSIGSAFTGAVVLIALLLPALYGKVEGYKVEALRQEKHKLLADRSALELQEAQLLSPERLERLALQQRFVDPDPRKIVFLSGNPDGTLAQSMLPSAGVSGAVARE